MPYRTVPISPDSPPSAEIRPPRRWMVTVALRLLALSFCVLTIVAGIGPIDQATPPVPIEWLAISMVALLAWLIWRRVTFLRGARTVLESQVLLNAGSYRAGGECCQRILDRYRGYGQLEAL